MVQGNRTLPSSVMRFYHFVQNFSNFCRKSLPITLFILTMHFIWGSFSCVLIVRARCGLCGYREANFALIQQLFEPKVGRKIPKTVNFTTFRVHKVHRVALKVKTTALLTLARVRSTIWLACDIYGERK